MIRSDALVVWLGLAGLAFVASVDAGMPGRSAPASIQAAPDLFAQVGFSTEDAVRARSGQATVATLPPQVNTEIAVAGGIRIRGDVERFVALLRDVKDLRTRLGVNTVGVIGQPPSAENFGSATLERADLDDLRRCRAGSCEIRMPADYIARFASEVPWNTPEAAAAATRLGRQLLSEYAAAYQTGGDAALGAHHNRQSPQAVATEFQDLLRRAATLWKLAYPFANYLERFPAERPEGIEDRFYWTRETGDKRPVTTLHHLVLQRLGDGSVRLADKQFYASRDLDAALLIGQATPSADRTAFDLVIAVRARSSKLGSMAARLVRGRIEREVSQSFATYLDWLQRSFALA